MTTDLGAPPVGAPAPQAPTPRAEPTSSSSSSVPLTRSRLIIRLVLITLTAGSIASLWWIGANPLTLFFERENVGNLIERMLPPRIDEPGLVWESAIETFLMAFAGTALGVVLAIPIAVAAARNISTNPVVRGAARALIVVTRALPELVLALIFVRVYSIGVLPGIMALGIHSIGMLGKLFADAIEQIDPGPREGVQATGSGRLQEFTTGIWPQVLPSVIAVSLYRLDINFRASTLLGLVGAGGIGLQIRAHQGSLDYEQLLGVTLVIIVLILAVEMVSTSIRSMILGHNRSKQPRLNTWLRRTPAVEQFTPADHDAAAAVANGQAAGNGDTAAVITGVDDGEFDGPASDRQRLRPPWTRERISMALFGAGTAVLLVLAFVIPDISFIEMIQGLPEIPRTMARLIPTNFEWWQTEDPNDAWWASDWITPLFETVAMGLGATGMALFFAIPTALLAARNVAPARWIYQASRLFILLVRALPDLIVAVIFVAALGLGPKPGVLALAIGLYGFATKLFADAIEEISEQPRDGVRATGASGVQELTTSVIPQAMPSIVSNSLYLFDVSLRASAVLGIVGAGGIGFALFQGMRLLRFDLVGGLLIIVFIFVYLIEMLSGWIRKQVI